MKVTRILGGIVVGVVLAAAACTTDSTPTGVRTASAPAVDASVSADDKAAPEAQKDARRAEHERLKAQRDSVRAEQKRIREESRAEYERAKAEWDQFKREWAEHKKGNKDENVELLRCKPLPYSADAEIIGPHGGELRMGPHKLVIPKGALDREMLIIGEAPTSSLVEVRFNPHGLQFVKSAELTLSYAHCMRPDHYTYRIVYVEGRQVLEFPPSNDDKTLKEVEAPIDHFSRYMIAY